LGVMGCGSWTVKTAIAADRRKAHGIDDNRINWRHDPL
jgi:hypothetical protein